MMYATVPSVGTGDVACVIRQDDNGDGRSVSSRSFWEDQRAKIALVELLYRPTTPRVRRQLESEPYICDFLIAAYFPLMSTFDEALRFGLRLFSDPEADRDTVLVVDIRSSRPVVEALERLDQFDNAWFIPHLPESDGRITFMLAF
jgi:hypothetical protein